MIWDAVSAGDQEGRIERKDGKGAEKANAKKAETEAKDEAKKAEGGIEKAEAKKAAP